jgi:hypothetical protein
LACRFAGPGSAALAPKGTRHTYGNVRKGERVRYLLVMTPRILVVTQLHCRPVFFCTGRAFGGYR